VTAGLIENVFGYTAHGRVSTEVVLIVLGVILLVLGLLVASLKALLVIGIILLVLGLILNFVPIGGTRRRFY